MRITHKHAIEELLKKRVPGAELVVVRNTPVADQLALLAREHGVPVRLRKAAPREAEAERGFYLEVPDRPGGEAVWEDVIRDLESKESALVLVLDGIEDPQNFGAILRSADQFGVDAVISPKRGAASLGPGAQAASSGAHAWVTRCSVPNLVRALEALKKAGFWVYGADPEGSPLPGFTFPEKTALVLGSEGRGLGRLVRETCDGLVGIPTQGHIDSLNVSVAAGILLYATRTQLKN